MQGQPGEHSAPEDPSPSPSLLWAEQGWTHCRPEGLLHMLCWGDSLHLLQSDRPLLVRAVANSPPDSAAGHSLAHPCRSHLIPSGHGAPVLTWPWLPGDPCLPPGSTTDVFLSTQERSSATSPRPRQLHPLHGAGRSGARSRALREQRAPAGRRRGPARHRHRRVSSAP